MQPQSTPQPESSGILQEARQHKRKAQTDISHKQAPPQRRGSCSSYKAHTTDFHLLADKFPSLRPFVFTNKYGSASVNWKDPYAVREVTYALLKSDFGLDLEIPIDQLCPPVPNRANYIYWLRDLLHDNSPQLLTSSSPLRGIDIGTGASCIYPLLGAKICGWSFVATDIDDTSLRHARRNLALNNLESTIELRQARPDHILLEAARAGEEYGFSMCNPPFFAGLEEACQNPRTVCTGTPNELVTAGGEVRFVERMIDESLILRHAIRWYTSMIGKKNDLNILTKILAAKGIVNVHTTTFYQGKTTRWGLAWSLTQDGLQSRVRAKVLEKLKGQDDMCFAVTTSTPSALLAHVRDLLRSLDISLGPSDDPFCLFAEVASNTWHGRPLHEHEPPRNRPASRQSLPPAETPAANERETREEAAADGKARTAVVEEVHRLGELQEYLGQYEQLLKALEENPNNPELLEMKGHLEEFVSLADQLYDSAEQPNAGTGAGTDNEAHTCAHQPVRPEPIKPQSCPAGGEADPKPGTPSPGPGNERGDETVRDSREGPPALAMAKFRFRVRVMQTQGASYMVQFSWASGASGNKQAFYELFDFLKHAISVTFARA